MIGLVLVSHSRKLAQALVDFVKEMNPKPIPIVAAGGVGNNNEELGTDATDILDAINSVYSDDGVIILLDMGSAMLSTELALDFLEPVIAQKIKICSAPLVEGSISASVQIALDMDIETVCQEALESLQMKQSHLQKDEKKVLEVTTTTNIEEFPKAEKILTINNLHGLHARPATKFVQTVGKFLSHVTVKNITKNKGPVNARSLNKLVALEIVYENQILILAYGNDAKEVITALTQLNENHYGESSKVSLEPVVKKKRTAEMFSVSEGYAIGRAKLNTRNKHVIKKEIIEQPQLEIKKFTEALTKSKNKISMDIENLKNILKKEELEIFEAHRVLLDDPDIIEQTILWIKNQKYSAQYAWKKTIEKVVKQYQNLKDEYLQIRANDIQDIGMRVLDQMMGTTSILEMDSQEPVILFDKTLTPSQVISLDSAKVIGIVTELGSSTSHVAILIRAIGIPALCGFVRFSEISDHQKIILDGFTSEIFIDPNEKIEKKYKQKLEEWKKTQTQQLVTAQQLATTKDSYNIEILANVSSIKEVELAARAGADGIGLFRTEFLFFERKRPPTEEEQYHIFCEVAKTLGIRKPITLRTFDLGGDKVLPYLSLEKEENPFLGVRGSRLYDALPKLFNEHIRAILRAANFYHFQIMLPMISQVEEFLKIKEIITNVHLDLQRDKITHRWPIKIGAMIETPSAVILAKELAQVADFFSIGTNDLTQYTMAAERGNTALEDYSDALHPAILRSIKTTVKAARDSNIPLSICGEVASELIAIPLLLGLGLNKISMVASKIPAIKERVRKINIQEEIDKNNQILLLENSYEVRNFLNKN